MRDTPGIDVGPAPTASTFGNFVPVKCVCVLGAVLGVEQKRKSWLAPLLGPGVWSHRKKSG